MDFGLVVGVRIRQDEAVSEEESAWRVQPGSKDGDPDIIIQKHVQAAARKARRPTSHALKPKLFAFDHVFNERIQTAQVYDAMVCDVITASCHGYHGTVACYGQSGSGKTFSMMGTKTQRGIIPLALRQVFEHVALQGSHRRFLIRCSYVEIYREAVGDLLAKNRGGGALAVREDPLYGPLVDGAKEVVIRSVQEALKVLARGEQHRHVGRTNMNEVSSRSHSILRVVMESVDVEVAAHGESEGEVGTAGSGASKVEEDDGTTAPSKDAFASGEKVCFSVLNLLDLAGSERVERTGATGTRKLEGIAINRSLLTLTTVISKLSERANSHGAPVHIPYRDSILTRLLQTSLGGNTRTAVLCTVSPAPDNEAESLNTLRFAGRAKHVVNRAHVNEMLDDKAVIKQYEKDIHNLRKQLAASKADTEASQRLSKLMESFLHGQQPTRSTNRPVRRHSVAVTDLHSARMAWAGRASLSPRASTPALQALAANQPRSRVGDVHAASRSPPSLPLHGTRGGGRATGVRLSVPSRIVDSDDEPETNEGSEEDFYAQELAKLHQEQAQASQALAEQSKVLATVLQLVKEGRMRQDETAEEVSDLGTALERQLQASDSLPATLRDAVIATVGAAVTATVRDTVGAALKDSARDSAARDSAARDSVARNSVARDLAAGSGLPDAVVDAIQRAMSSLPDAVNSAAAAAQAAADTMAEAASTVARHAAAQESGRGSNSEKDSEGHYLCVGSCVWRRHGGGQWSCQQVVNVDPSDPLPVRLLNGTSLKRSSLVTLNPALPLAAIHTFRLLAGTMALPAGEPALGIRPARPRPTRAASAVSPRSAAAPARSTGRSGAPRRGGLGSKSSHNSSRNRSCAGGHSEAGAAAAVPPVDRGGSGAGGESDDACVTPRRSRGRGGTRARIRASPLVTSSQDGASPGAQQRFSLRKTPSRRTITRQPSRQRELLTEDETMKRVQVWNEGEVVGLFVGDGDVTQELPSLHARFMPCIIAGSPSFNLYFLHTADGAVTKPVVGNLLVELPEPVPHVIVPTPCPRLSLASAKRKYLRRASHQQQQQPRDEG